MVEQDVPGDTSTTPPASSFDGGWRLLLLALAPALVALAWCPNFVTQDGPAHVYNAHILLESLHNGGGEVPGPVGAAYRVQWLPLPNWAGHLSLMGLMAAGLPPRDADRLVMALTLVAVALSAFGLRLVVAGRRGAVPAALLSALAALNVMWLFGFYSFLLGAALFAATLAAWWAGRDRPGPAWAAGLATLLVAGYGAHIVSLGLTALGLVVLAFGTPGPAPLRRHRGAWTLLSLLPLVPLAGIYRGLMREGGGLDPTWPLLTDPLSPRCWREHLTWIDPLSLGSKLAAPFALDWSRTHLLLAPVFWTLAALAALVIATLRAVRPGGATSPSPLHERRGFVLLSLLLLAGGLFGPDAFGPRHGNYLAQRLLLLSLVAALPLLDGSMRRGAARLATAALAVAVVVQSAFVWDFALRSERAVSGLLAARPLVGQGQRVGTLLLELRQPFRANPIRHADCLLGVGTQNVVWSNYESAHYYFPVRVRDDVPHPPVLAFEEAALRDHPARADDRARAWTDLLAAHHDAIDTLVILGRDTRLESITARWFAPSAAVGRAQVFRRRSQLVQRPGSPPL